MEKFTASNGATVEEIETASDGTRLVVWAPHPYNDIERSLGGSTTAYLIDDQRDALREYFQAERDAELGRWRHPTFVNWVAYPQSDSDAVLVVDETVGWAHIYRRDETSGHGTRISGAYFAAHPQPEPRPWENAKPGELWAVTTENVGDEVATQVIEIGGELTFTWLEGLHRKPLNDSTITSARRIWPEAAA